MQHSHRFRWPCVRVLELNALAIAFLSTAAVVEAQYATPPISLGQTYFVATNTFDGFFAPGSQVGQQGPLELLAAEAELTGHENLGVQLSDGSATEQHWNQGGADESRNPTKVALRTGGVDVLMMSPIGEGQDGDVELFGDLLSETNIFHTSIVLTEILTKSYVGFSDHGFLSEDVEKCIFEPPRSGFIRLVWNRRWYSGKPFMCTAMTWMDIG